MTSSVHTSRAAAFFSDVARARHRLLLMDYDGTIAPFTTNRKKSFPYSPVANLIMRIMTACSTRVVLISGRTASEVPPLLGLVPPPEVWGVHGLERLYPDGRLEVVPIPSDATAALSRAFSLLTKEEGLEDLVERKSGAIAVHWRGCSAAAIEDARTRTYPILARVACEADLRLSEFDGGLELRARASNKSHAVRTLVSEVGDDVPVAYLGDDVTDEDAFKELNGRGLTVVVGALTRRSNAQIWLSPPDDLVQFLRDWVHSCGGAA